MKLWLALMLALSSQRAFANGLPVFSLQPTNESVLPGGAANLAISAMGADGYQWRFDGTDIPGATNETLQISDVQITNTGYYVAIARNSTGWVPSQMAYLSINYNRGGAYPPIGGLVPLSNVGNTYVEGQIGYPWEAVQIVAGPELDQMQTQGLVLPYGDWLYNDFTNGYFDAPDQFVNTVAPGQNVYYSVLVTITDETGDTYTLPSTVMLLVAGGNDYPTPSNYGLKFPDSIEWPEPTLYESPATNQLVVAGETLSITDGYGAYNDFGIPTVQWRKDGKNIPGATNFSYSTFSFFGQSIFTITNLQTSDAGVYDTIIYGDLWEVSPKIYISVQASVQPTNEPAILENPSDNGSSFVCTLVGTPGKNYELQESSNLVNWVNLGTLANVTGTVTFSYSTNLFNLGNPQFYRTMLLP
jgi:hypothetical protein